MSDEAGMVNSVMPRRYARAGGADCMLFKGVTPVMCAELREEVLRAESAVCREPVRLCNLLREGALDCEPVVCPVVWAFEVKETSAWYPFKMLPPLRRDHKSRLPAAVFCVHYYGIRLQNKCKIEGRTQLPEECREGRQSLRTIPNSRMGLRVVIVW
jgi:hypothetical protein